MSRERSSRGWDRREWLAGMAFAALAPLGRAVGPGAGRGRLPTLAERLGYPREARLLILHADDLGLLHTVNAAAMAAFESGPLRSGSAMPPCPWCAEIGGWARDQPAADLGVHLTFICERPGYRWGPVLGPSAVPSLVDRDGFFPASWEPDRRVNLAELEAEIRAQIARARALGIVPTHLDSHGNTLQWNGRAVFEVLLGVARDERLPVRVGRNWFARHPELAQALGPDGIILDRTLTIPPSVPRTQWLGWYTSLIQGPATGVTEIFLHPAYDDGEMRAFAGPGLSYGSAWRARDLEVLQRPELRAAIAAAGATLITWRDIQRLLA